MPPIVQFSSSTYTAYAGTTSTYVTVTRGGGGRRFDRLRAVSPRSEGRPFRAWIHPRRGYPHVPRQPDHGDLLVPILEPSRCDGRQDRWPGAIQSQRRRAARTHGAAPLTIQPGASPYNPVGPTNPTPPQVTSEQLVSAYTGITAVLFTIFSQPMNPRPVCPTWGIMGTSSTSRDPTGCLARRPTRIFHSPRHSTIPSRPPSRCIPNPPCPTIGSRGSSSTDWPIRFLSRGLINTSGVLLSGLSNAVPGNPYVATFGAGTSLAYADNLGKVVTLTLTGAGIIEIDRTAAGNPQSVSLVGAVPGQSLLTFQASKAGGRTTFMPPIRAYGGEVPIQDACRSFPPDRPPAHGQEGTARQDCGEATQVTGAGPAARDLAMSAGGNSARPPGSSHRVTGALLATMGPLPQIRPVSSGNVRHFSLPNSPRSDPA